MRKADREEDRKDRRTGGTGARFGAALGEMRFGTGGRHGEEQKLFSQPRNANRGSR